MIIGVPKEVKIHESRVGLTPAGVRELTTYGHTVLIESNLGTNIGFSDQHYILSGAQVVPSAKDVFAKADLIIKVKEPQKEEFALIRDGQILFTYLHLAAEPEVTSALLKSGCTAIAYETVTNDRGELPLLAPMSDVAGRMSVQVAARYLESEQGGMGLLMSGAPGVLPAKVCVIGGGVAGLSAARLAKGLGADVTIVEKSPWRLQYLDSLFQGNIKTVFSTAESIEAIVRDSDAVMGCVLVPGALAPRLVTHKMIQTMKPGSVVVDLAIDQGGCFETSQPTTHAKPIYVVDNVIHYCVTNMPGAVARTSAIALSNATLPFILALANKGYRQALQDDLHLANGLNIYQGTVTHEAVARSLNFDFQSVAKTLAH